MSENKEIIYDNAPYPRFTTKQEFKEVHDELKKLFEEMKKRTNNFQNYTKVACETVASFRKKEINEFMNKHQISGYKDFMNTDEDVSRQEIIISIKLSILLEMIDRYRQVVVKNVSDKYISTEVENAICDVILLDNTGFIRANAQLNKLVKEINKNEAKLRTKMLGRVMLFKPELNFRSTYYSTIMHFSRICPNKINAINILWKVR